MSSNDQAAEPVAQCRLDVAVLVKLIAYPALRAPDEDRRRG
jgi:hypothetical protein